MKILTFLGIICALALSLLFVGAANAATESYTGGAISYAQNIRDGFTINSTSQMIGQSYNITGSGTYNIQAIAFQLNRSTTEATNYMRVALYAANTSGGPLGNEIEVSNTLVMSSITLNGAATYINFTFNGSTLLNRSNSYVAVLAYNGSGTPTIRAMYNTTGTYTGGNGTWKSAGTTQWSALGGPTPDFNFVITYTSASINFSIKANDKYNNTMLNVFNASVTWNGTTTNYTTSGGEITTNIFSNSTPNAANVSVVANNYFVNTTINNNLSALNVTLTPYTAIRAQSYLGGSPGGILNFSVNYTGITNTSHTGTVTTTTGLAYIPIYNGTYTITIYDANNGTTQYSSSSANVTPNPYLHSYNFTLYLTNTVLGFVFNENTQTLITAPVNVYFVGTIISYNYSTTNGTINASILQPQDYQVIVTSANYSTRNYYFTLQNQSINSLLMYLLPIPYNTVLLTVIDQSYNVLDGYYVSQMRLNITGTNHFETEECLTDVNGQCLMATSLCTTNDTTCAYYNYYIYDPSGTLVGTTGNTRVTSNTLNIQVATSSATIQYVTNQFGLQGSVTIDNTTGIVTYILVNTNSFSTTSSLEISRRVGNTWAVVSSNSTSGTGTSILTGFANLSSGYEYKACGYFTNNGQTVLIDCDGAIDLGTSTGQQAEVSGWLLLVAICIPLFFMGYNIMVPPIVTTMLLYLFQLMGLLAFPQVVVGGIVVVVVVVLWVIFN